MSNSHKGKILISTPDASGDIFSRSVVLVIEHNEAGAFGLILNKKKRNLRLKLPTLLGKEVEIFDGGPVSPDKLFFIIQGEIPTDTAATSINNEYYMTDDLEMVVLQMMEEKIDSTHIKVFAGYSGWSASQLEMEILNKVWTVLDVANMEFTNEEDSQLWKKLMLALGGEFLLWANAPEDVNQN